jgi:hypothetical protein
MYTQENRRLSVFLNFSKVAKIIGQELPKIPLKKY